MPLFLSVSLTNKDIITSDEILGKEVVNSEGEIKGVVQKIHIDKRTKEIMGITVDEGFMKPDLFIGVENIKLFGLDAVFMNTASDMKFKGLKIIDNQGHIVGTVVDIIRSSKTGKIEEVTAKNKTSTYTIQAKEIKSINENVLLK